jgi:hypothetical protein
MVLILSDPSYQEEVQKMAICCLHHQGDNEGRNQL